VKERKAAKRAALAVSVAEYSLTGIDTRPKLRVSEAMERAAMGTSLASGG
jgi:hypothetical protein